VKIALAQISPKLSRDNFELHFKKIEEAKKKDASVVVFPELSMNGYMLMDSVYEDAFLLEELDEFAHLSSDIDIVIGAVTKEEHRIYNSALYYSGGALVAIHHKNYLPNYGMFQEARFFFKGDGFESFETRFGRSMMVVCEDLWSSKTIDKIALEKPDFVFVIANSPSRDFSDEGVLEIEKKWTRILSTTSILSGANVIFVNRVGFEDGMGFWGGSKILSPNGKVSVNASLFEKELLIATVNRRVSDVQKYLLRGDG
jgi:predicted amidohydrolase